MQFLSKRFETVITLCCVSSLLSVMATLWYCFPTYANTFGVFAFVFLVLSICALFNYGLLLMLFVGVGASVGATVGVAMYVAFSSLPVIAAFMFSSIAAMCITGAFTATCIALQSCLRSLQSAESRTLAPQTPAYFNLTKTVA